MGDLGELGEPWLKPNGSTIREGTVEVGLGDPDGRGLSVGLERQGEGDLAMHDYQCCARVNMSTD